MGHRETGHDPAGVMGVEFFRAAPAGPLRRPALDVAQQCQGAAMSRVRERTCLGRAAPLPDERDSVLRRCVIYSGLH